MEPGTPPSLIHTSHPQAPVLLKKSIKLVCCVSLVTHACGTHRTTVRVNSLLLPYAWQLGAFPGKLAVWPTSSQLKYVSTNSRVKHTQEPQSKHSGLPAFFPARPWGLITSPTGKPMPHSSRSEWYTAPNIIVWSPSKLQDFGNTTDIGLSMCRRKQSTYT